MKTLIKLDPDDRTPVRTLVSSGVAKQVLHTVDDKPLFDLLNEFQEGKGMSKKEMLSFSTYLHLQMFLVLFEI